MPKPIKSIKLNAAKQKKVMDALTALRDQYASLAEVWAQLTPAQRDAVLAHSPVLSAVVTFAKQFEVTHGTGL